jgi:hypothetical protein
MLPRSRFPYLDSRDAGGNNGLWAWAKRLVDALSRWKLFDLMDVPTDDKPLYVMRVNADGTAFELAPEELGLAGADLTGKGGQVIRVKATEDGFEITPEELGLFGVDLTGKANFFVKVNATEDGFTLSAA